VLEIINTHVAIPNTQIAFSNSQIALPNSQKWFSFALKFIFDIPHDLPELKLELELYFVPI